MIFDISKYKKVKKDITYGDLHPGMIVEFICCSDENTDDGIIVGNLTQAGRIYLCETTNKLKLLGAEDLFINEDNLDDELKDGIIRITKIQNNTGIYNVKNT